VTRGSHRPGDPVDPVTQYYNGLQNVDSHDLNYETGKPIKLSEDENIYQ